MIVKGAMFDSRMRFDGLGRISFRNNPRLLFRRRSWSSTGGDKRDDLGAIQPILDANRRNVRVVEEFSNGTN